MAEKKHGPCAGLRMAALECRERAREMRAKADGVTKPELIYGLAGAEEALLILSRWCYRRARSLEARRG